MMRCEAIEQISSICAQQSYIPHFSTQDDTSSDESADGHAQACEVKVSVILNHLFMYNIYT